MSTPLKDLLDDIADQARPVDVTDRALTIGRRRRRATRLAPAAVAGLLALVLLAVGLPLRDTPRPVAPAAPWYESLPATVTPPAAAPPLPAAAVAGGLLLTSRCESGCPVLLYAANHRWYRVPGTDQHTSLSPDGRWLWMSDGRHPVVRDLLGNRSFAVGEYLQVMSWSPDGRWALAEKVHPAVSHGVAVEGGGTEYDGTWLRIELATGRTAAFALGDVERSQTLGVLPSGDLLVAAQGAPPTAPLPAPSATLRTARGDLVIGTARSGARGLTGRVTVRGGGLWTSGTEQAGNQPPVSTAWQWYAYAVPFLTADGTAVDYEQAIPPPGAPLDTGGRWEIIVRLGTGTATWYRMPDDAHPVQYLGGTQLVAVTTSQDRSGQLFRYDLRAGGRRPVSRLPAHTTLPGQTLDQPPS